MMLPFLVRRFYPVLALRLTAFWFALACIVLPLPTWAQSPGKIDPAFAPTIRSVGTVHCITTQPDGRQLVGGSFTNASATRAHNLVRLNADGGLDAGFVPPTDLGEVYYIVSGEGGKAFVLSMKFGETQDIYTLARLNADGSQDASFVPVSFAGESNTGQLHPFLLAAQPDGKILVGGSFTDAPDSTDATTTIKRFNTDGSLDASFRLASELSPTQIDSLLPLPSGQIIATGNFYDYLAWSYYSHGLIRLNADGSLDSSYPTASSPTKTGFDLTLQPDGKVLYLRKAGDAATVLGGVPQRLNTDGSPDAGFSPQTDASASFLSLRLQPDGKVVAAGAVTSGLSSFNGATIQNGLVRLNTDGSADASFRAGPPLVDSYTGTNPDSAVPSAIGQLTAFGLQGNGQVLVGGNFKRTAGSPRLSLGRLNGDGGFDPTFRNDLTTVAETYAASVGADGLPLLLTAGPVINAVPSSNLASFNADGSLHTVFAVNLGAQVRYAGGPYTNFTPVLASQADGKVLVAANFSDYVAENAQLQRFNADGSNDGGFNAVFYDFTVLNAVLPQADGRIYVAGSLFNYSENPTTYPLRRLNVDGSDDPAFTPANDPGATLYASSDIYALATQPDGKILAAGVFKPVKGQVQPGVLRFNPDGSVDPGFETGAFTNNRTGYGGSARVLVPQPDGKVLVAGNFTAIGGTAANGVARLNPDGGVDSSFGANTTVDGAVTALVRQADGKLLLGGTFATVNGVGRPGVARLNPDGSLDAQFDPGSGTDADGHIRFVTLTGDGSVLVGGDFTRFDGQPREGVVRLFGGDALPVVNLLASVPKVTAGTGQKGVVLITRSGDDLSTDLLVRYSVKGTAVNGTDYVFLRGKAKIKAGKASKGIKISPLGGGAGAGNKRVATLLLESDAGYTLGQSTKQKIKIFGQ